jgi:hypothetical protein
MLPLITAFVPQLLNMFAGMFGIDTTSEDVKLKLAELELRSQQMISDQMKEQMDINEAEAANTNRTWPTWRECLGYVCVIAVAYHFVIQQFIVFILHIFGQSVELPALDMTGLMTILSAMLGIHYVNSRFNSTPGSMPPK